MEKTVQYINDDNVQIEFSYREDAPFFLVQLEGVYTIEHDVNMTDNTMIDGAIYQSSTTRKRNIIITAQMDHDYVKNRNIIYGCFRQGSKGTFRYIEGDEIREIECVPEKVDIDEKGVVRNFTISLLCPFPFFKDMNDTTVTMAGWENVFEFEHEFKEPEELTRRITELIKEIDNFGTVKETGMEILIIANADVVNPVVHHIEQNKFVRIEKTLKTGEAIRITTGIDDKMVYFIDAAGKETEANGYIDEDSEFIQLINGSNNIQYDAEEGAEHMDVSIKYRTLYLGV